MKVRPGIDLIEIPYELDGIWRTNYPTLLHDHTGVTLIDTGSAGDLPHIAKGFEAAGVRLRDLSTIILTHHDRDHIEALPELLAVLPAKPRLLAHSAEIPYIQGDRIFKRRAPEGETDLPAPPERKTGVVIDGTIEDFERLPLHGGMIAIHTPGHTPGHLCFYLEESRILISGDQLNVKNGRIQGPIPKYSHDVVEARLAVDKLARLPMAGIISFHGGYLEGGIEDKIAALPQEEDWKGTGGPG